MYPSTGVIEKSGLNLAISHLNLQHKVVKVQFCLHICMLTILTVTVEISTCIHMYYKCKHTLHTRMHTHTHTRTHAHHTHVHKHTPSPNITSIQQQHSSITLTLQHNSTKWNVVIIQIDLNAMTGTSNNKQGSRETRTLQHHLK